MSHPTRSLGSIRFYPIQKYTNLKQILVNKGTIKHQKNPNHLNRWSIQSLPGKFK